MTKPTEMIYEIFIREQKETKKKKERKGPNIIKSKEDFLVENKLEQWK